MSSIPPKSIWFAMFTAPKVLPLLPLLWLDPSGCFAAVSRVLQRQDLHAKPGGDPGHHAAPGGCVHRAGAQVGADLRPGHPRGGLHLRVCRQRHHRGGSCESLLHGIFIVTLNIITSFSWQEARCVRRRAVCKGCQYPSPCWTRQIKVRPSQPWARCSVFVPSPAGRSILMTLV